MLAQVFFPVSRPDRRCWAATCLGGAIRCAIDNGLGGWVGPFRVSKCPECVNPVHCRSFHNYSQCGCLSAGFCLPCRVPVRYYPLPSGPCLPPASQRPYLLRFVTGQFFDLRWTCLLHPWQRPSLDCSSWLLLKRSSLHFQPYYDPERPTIGVSLNVM